MYICIRGYWKHHHVSNNLLNKAKTNCALFRSSIQHSLVYKSNFTAVDFTLTIVSNSSSPSADSDGDYDLNYIAGSDVNLTCMVTPPPPPNSEFSWNCSTGCLEGIEMEQTIRLASFGRIESGVMSCSMDFGGNVFQSQSFHLRVIGEKSKCT